MCVQAALCFVLHPPQHSVFIDQSYLPAAGWQTHRHHVVQLAPQAAPIAAARAAARAAVQLAAQAAGPQLGSVPRADVSGWAFPGLAGKMRCALLAELQRQVRVRRSPRRTEAERSSPRIGAASRPVPCA